jgi:hypothetical protein
MSKIAELSEKDDFPSVFFATLVSLYASHGNFFDMLCTLPYPFSDFISIVHKAYQDTLSELGEITDPSIPKWKLVSDLKRRLQENPHDNLIGLGNTIVALLKTTLEARKEKCANSARLWDTATRDDWGDEPRSSVFSMIEIQKTRGMLKRSNDQEDGNPSAVAYFQTAPKAGDVATDVTDELSIFINDPVHGSLAGAYKAYTGNAGKQTAASDCYRKFRAECRDLLKDVSAVGQLPEDLTNLIRKILDHPFRGKSFPSFPGVVAVNSCPRFPNIHDKPGERLYSFRLYGEAWNEDKTILPALLELKESLETTAETVQGDAADTIEDPCSTLTSYLSLLGIQNILLRDFKPLFKKLVPLVESEFLPRHDYRLYDDTGKMEKPRKYLVSPKTIQPQRLVVFVHENISSDRKREIANEHDTTYWFDTKEHGLQEFIAYLVANTEFFPAEIIIYHKLIDGDLRSKLNSNMYRFFASLKAAIDSAVLFLIDDAGLQQAFKLLGHEFQHVKSGDNIWFLPFLMRDVKNSLFHDFYYMLLKGVSAWEARYYESSRGLAPLATSKGSAEINVRKIVRESWKGKSALNRSRKRLNVQFMTYPMYTEPGEHVKTGEELRELFGDPLPFYTFNKSGKMLCYYYDTKNKDRRIALPDRYLERFLSRRKDISRAYGGLFTDKWYITAHSLKNTSTAGYTLRDAKKGEIIATSDFLLLSLSSETWLGKKNQEPRYIRNASLHAHLSSEREVQVQEENFIEDHAGSVDPEVHYKIASCIVAELGKENIPVILRVKHSGRTEETHQMISQAADEEARKQINQEGERELIDDPDIEWVYERNKKRKVPLFIYYDKAIISPARAVKKLVPPKTNRQLAMIIEETLLSLNGDRKKLIGMLVYGSRRQEVLEGSIRKKDLLPSMIFTVIPEETPSANVIEVLDRLVETLPCYGDEKGGVSVASLSRLFHLPYPDPVKLTDPSIFIKGINRYDFPTELM